MNTIAEKEQRSSLDETKKKNFKNSLHFPFSDSRKLSTDPYNWHRKVTRTGQL